MNGSSPRRPPLLPVALLFLLSGAAGLVYEVVWSRQLARVLGGSYPAVVAVVTVFLGGLALGAALGGLWAARLRRPLLAYGLLEGGIGLYCAAFPWVLAALHPVFGWCYRTFEGEPALHAAARFLVAAAALLPPTAAMGASLPVLVRAVVREDRGVLSGTGLLYGINTLGAAGGAWLAGFVLLPELGFRGTLWTGASANLAVAAVAWGLDVLGNGRAGSARPYGIMFGAGSVAAQPVASQFSTPGNRESVPMAGPGGAGSAATENLPPQVRRTLFLLAAGSGFTGMLYQLGWTRALVLCFGSSVHAFTLIVAVFILGLGLGGLLAPAFRGRGRGALLPLVLVEAAVGIAGWMSVVQIAHLPVAVAGLTGEAIPDYPDLLRWEAGRTLMLALLPTLGMGAVFPLIVAALDPGAEGASRAVGRVYAVNTAGVILGSLGGGLVLIPALGTRALLLAAVVLNLLLAGALAAAAWPRVRGLAAAGGLLALGGFLAGAAPAWHPWRMHAGAFIYRGDYQEKAGSESIPLDRAMRDDGWDMPYASEGRSAAVAVFRNPDGSLFLRVNGKTDASTWEDRSTQMLLGHLPALLRGSPDHVLVVGLATGMSAAAAASHGPRSLDIAEISAEVLEAERLFRPWNGDVTHRPGARVLLEDGRTHLEHAGDLYDAITSEPTNPWIAGVSDLFTVEYFEACRDRLAPGGVVGIWLQSYNLSVEDFRLVVRTFRSVFPGATVWELVPGCDYCLIASREEGTDLAAGLASRPWPGGEAAASLAAAGLRGPEDALALLFLDREETAAFAAAGGDASLHTDDRLQLEFRAPRGAFEARSYQEMDYWTTRAMRGSGPHPDLPGIDPARWLGVRESRDRALRGLEASWSAGGGFYRERSLKRASQRKDAAAVLGPFLPPSLRAAVEAWTLRPGTLLSDDAAEGAARAVAIHGLEGALEVGAAEIWISATLVEEWTELGGQCLDEGALDLAERAFRRIAEIQPWNALAPCGLSRVLVRRAKGNRGSPHLAEALSYVEKSLELNPRCEIALVQRGEVYRAMGRPDEAVKALLEALEVREDSVPALGLLAALCLEQGRREDALILVNRALDLVPGKAELVALRARIP